MTGKLPAGQDTFCLTKRHFAILKTKPILDIQKGYFGGYLIQTILSLAILEII
jgi:hypothetical protein